MGSRDEKGRTFSHPKKTSYYFVSMGLSLSLFPRFLFFPPCCLLHICASAPPAAFSAQLGEPKYGDYNDPSVMRMDRPHDHA
jgi:hypothetical protein